MATATISAEPTKSAVSSCGARVIPVTGGTSNLPRRALRLLLLNLLTPISPLVTYCVDCRVRYKITAWRKTQRL